MKIKICGITNTEDAQNAVSLGADALGFIFHKSSPRYVSVEKAEEISLFLPPFISLVGVFVNHELAEIQEIADRCKLNLIQLHGDETPDFCLKMPRRVIKAFRVSDLEDIEPIPKYKGMVSGILLDTRVKDIEGGTGKTFDWGLATKAKENDIPLVLAGGINEANLNKAVQIVNPYAIDVSSSIESEPGKKDYNKMNSIIELAHSI